MALVRGPVATPRGPAIAPARMPDGWPAYLRDCTKKVVKERDAALALWVCEEIRKWDLLIGQTPARTQQRVYLPSSGYDCMCHYEGCRAIILRGTAVLWDPDHGSYHAYHFPTECPPLPFDRLDEGPSA